MEKYRAASGTIWEIGLRSVQEMMMNVSSARYLDKLASLRFFAAALVVLFHLRVLTWPYHGIFKKNYLHTFEYGYVGVSIFFILSGFVISFANANWRGWKRYLMGRAARIYPSHWIILFSVAAYAVIMYFQQYGITVDSWLSLLANLALVQAWVPDEAYYFSMDVVSWSLSVEIFFYVSFLFLRRLSDKSIYILSAFSYLALVIAAVLLRHTWSDTEYWVFDINPVVRLPEFLIGMALYRLYKSGRLPKLWLPKFNFALILIGLIATMTLISWIPVGVIKFKYAYTYSIVPVPFAVLMIIALLDEKSNAYMRHRSLILLGEASFALYLIHRPIIDYVFAFTRQYPIDSGVTMTVCMCLVLVSCVYLSVIFYKYVELPLTGYLKRRFVNKPA